MRTVAVISVVPLTCCTSVTEQGKGLTHKSTRAHTRTLTPTLTLTGSTGWWLQPALLQTTLLLNHHLPAPAQMGECGSKSGCLSRSGEGPNCNSSHQVSNSTCSDCLSGWYKPSPIFFGPCSPSPVPSIILRTPVPQSSLQCICFCYWTCCGLVVSASPSPQQESCFP